MILRHFPDFTNSRFAQWFTPRWGRENTLIWGRARLSAYGQVHHALSIKTVTAGREFYDIDGRSVAVEPECYLVLNHGRAYGSHIESEEEVDSFSIWFRPGLAEEIYTVLDSRLEDLLDQPGYVRPGYGFFEHRRAHDAWVTPLLGRLYRAVVLDQAEEGWVEERLHVLMERLLRAEREVVDEVERIRAVRRSTRLELYRRLHKARDFIESHFERSLDLGSIAGIACLAPHHFLRSYKQFFHLTPYQHLARKRLSAARDLLGETDLAVSLVCNRVGFANQSAFSRAYRRRFGETPTQTRNKIRKPGTAGRPAAGYVTPLDSLN